MSFFYVYILRSKSKPDRFYTGCTQDLTDRLQRHNRGQVAHTKKYRPWQVETAIALRDSEKAHTFEGYLKSHSGRQFAKRHW